MDEIEDLPPVLEASADISGYACTSFFKEKFNEKTFSDVQLKSADGVCFYCHKLLISSVSAPLLAKLTGGMASANYHGNCSVSGSLSLQQCKPLALCSRLLLLLSFWRAASSG